VLLVLPLRTNYLFVIIPASLIQIIAEYAVPSNRGIECDREFREIDTSNGVKALVIKRIPNRNFDTFTISTGRNRWVVEYTYFPTVAELLKSDLSRLTDIYYDKIIRQINEPYDEHLLYKYSILKIREIFETFELRN
jgi:hypothetical protein